MDFEVLLGINTVYIPIDSIVKFVREHINILYQDDQGPHNMQENIEERNLQAIHERYIYYSHHTINIYLIL